MNETKSQDFPTAEATYRATLAGLIRQRDAAKAALDAATARRYTEMLHLRNEYAVAFEAGTVEAARGFLAGLEEKDRAAEAERAGAERAYLRVLEAIEALVQDHDVRRGRAFLGIGSGRVAWDVGGGGSEGRGWSRLPAAAPAPLPNGYDLYRPR